MLLWLWCLANVSDACKLLLQILMRSAQILERYVKATASKLGTIGVGFEEASAIWDFTDDDRVCLRHVASVSFSDERLQFSPMGLLAPTTVKILD